MEDTKRIPMTIYGSRDLAKLTKDAARQHDQTQSGYMRSALVEKLHRDGFDIAAAATSKR